MQIAFLCGLIICMCTHTLYEIYCHNKLWISLPRSMKDIILYLCDRYAQASLGSVLLNFAQWQNCNFQNFIITSGSNWQSAWQIVLSEACLICRRLKRRLLFVDVKHFIHNVVMLLWLSERQTTQAYWRDWNPAACWVKCHFHRSVKSGCDRPIQPWWVNKLGYTRYGLWQTVRSRLTSAG